MAILAHNQFSQDNQLSQHNQHDGPCTSGHVSSCLANAQRSDLALALILLRSFVPLQWSGQGAASKARLAGATSEGCWIQDFTRSWQLLHHCRHQVRMLSLPKSIMHVNEVCKQAFAFWTCHDHETSFASKSSLLPHPYLCQSWSIHLDQLSVPRHLSQETV